MSDHPLVAAYLRRLAAASTGARSDRQRALLDDVAAHLRDTVAPNATDDHARRLLAEFGEPEVLAAEAFGTHGGVAGQRRRTLLRTGGVLAAAGAAATLLAVVVTTSLHRAQAGTDAQRPVSAATASFNPAAAVVTLHPSGPDRTTEGRTYAEYVREIATLPPLPPDAQYPEGVPAQPEPTDPVMAETGTGAVIADFTWLCAWESEYLEARDAQAYDRLLVAEQALRSWLDFTPFPTPDSGYWAENVLAPLDFDDPSGVRADRPEACAQAGISNAGR